MNSTMILCKKRFTIYFCKYLTSTVRSAGYDGWNAEERCEDHGVTPTPTTSG